MQKLFVVSEINELESIGSKVRVQVNLKLKGRSSSCPGWHCVCIKDIRGGVKEVKECVSAGVGVGGGVGLWVKLQWAWVRVCLDSIYHQHKAQQSRGGRSSLEYTYPCPAVLLYISGCKHLITESDFSLSTTPLLIRDGLIFS